MSDALRLLVIYNHKSFRVRTLQNVPKDWKVRWIELDDSHPMRDFEPIQLTEPLDGPDGEFLRIVIDDRPDLLLVEVAPSDATPHNLIHLLKTSAATRRIPVLAVGCSETDLKTASRSGANQTFLEAAWQSTAADFLTDWSARHDERRFDLGCSGALHPLAAQGVEAINAGEYYQAHELLEEAWMAVDEVEGYLYRGLLQVAVAHLQMQRHNLRGAFKMLLRMRQWVDPLPDTCRGIDVDQLRGMMASMQKTLENLSINQSAAVRPKGRQPIPLDPSSTDAGPGLSNKNQPSKT